MSGRLFHVVLPRDWRAFLASGAPVWRPPSLGREGFCHLSFAEQLEGTLETHFAARREVVLLELDAARVDGDLRLEPARDHLELFPHLYRAIRRDEILGRWRVERGGAGWGLPQLGAPGQADRPPAERFDAP